MYIKIGEQKLVQARVTDAADNIVATNLTWASGNSAICTVQQSDLQEKRAVITGVAAGTTSITCTDGTTTGTLSVTVHDGSVTSITIS